MSGVSLPKLWPGLYCRADNRKIIPFKLYKRTTVLTGEAAFIFGVVKVCLESAVN